MTKNGTYWLKKEPPSIPVGKAFTRTDGAAIFSTPFEFFCYDGGSSKKLRTVRICVGDIRSVLTVERIEINEQKYVKIIISYLKWNAKGLLTETVEGYCVDNYRTFKYGLVMLDDK